MADEQQRLAEEARIGEGRVCSEKRWTVYDVMGN
jgi:hypothetical protein